MLDSGLKKQFPYQSRFFQVGRQKIHYIDEGFGPVVLMMHSCPFWSFEFRALIADLSRDHRVIAMDQMGFGLSDKPEDYDYRLETHANHVDSFVHALGLKKFSMILHGRGATIGMAYAVRHPDDISGFVTFNAQAFSEFTLPFGLQICRLKWIGAKILMLLNIFGRDIKHLPPEVREKYIDPVPGVNCRLPLQRFIEDIPCVPEDLSAQTMFTIENALWLLLEKPACIIWAEKDWLYKKSDRDRWRKYFPKAEYHTLKDAGRCITEDAPGEINGIVRDFLTRNKI